MLYQEAKERLIAGLLQDVAAHEAGRYEDIGADYDKVDSELPRGMDPEFDKLHVALHFWDGWIDARNHNWHFYEPITKEAWPDLARHIVKDVRADLDITHTLIVSKFDFTKQPPHTSVWQKLKNILIGR